MAKAKAKSKLEKMKSVIPNIQTLNSKNCIYHRNDFVDTGNYAFNVAVSGKLTMGIPKGDTIVISGDPATGKSYFLTMSAVNFLKQNEEHVVYLFDTEGYVSINLIPEEVRDRYLIIPCRTVEELKFKFADIISAIRDNEMIGNVMVLVDSLGNVSSSKEIKDTYGKNEKQDMTKAKTLKAFFRIFLIDILETKTILMISNHTYDDQKSFFGGSVQAGGKGSKYASYTTINLTKSKSKEGLGVVSKCWIDKTRWVAPIFTPAITILFKKGIDRYSGLVEILESLDVISKSGNTLRYKDISGTKKLFKRKFKEFLENSKEELDEISQIVYDKISLSTTKYLDNIDYDDEDDIEESDE